MNGRRDAGDGLLVLAAAALAYAAALAGTFVYDDVHSVVANTAIAERDVCRYFTDPGAFSASAGRMYRPVLLTTLAWNHALGGLSPVLFKATDVLLHGLTAWLLLGLLRGLGAGRGGSLLAALLFACHPLASEAVNMVSARSEVLLVLGLLLALRCHLRARGRGGPAMVGHLGVLLGGCIACGSKETGVVLPALLLLQEWALLRPGRLSWRAAGAGFLRVLPAALLVLGYLLVRRALLGQATVQLLGRSSQDLTVGAGRDLATQLWTMGTLLPRGLLSMLLPLDLSLDPWVVWHRGPDLPAVAGWLLLALLTLLAAWRLSRSPAGVVGLGFAWLCALPWIVVPLNVPFAEHRLYGPLAGVAMLAVPPWWQRLQGMRAGWWRPRPWALPALLLLLAAGASTWRSLAYRDERELWLPVVAAQPTNYRAHWALGLAQANAGELLPAVASLARASCLHPGHRSSKIGWLENLVRLPVEHQQPFLGLVLADQLLLEKDEPYVRILAANCWTQAGTATGDPECYARSERVALSCLEIASPKGLVFRVAAEARARAGDLPGAIALLDRSLALGCDHISVRLDRLDLLTRAGRLGDADAELQRCLQLAPLAPQVQAAMQRLRAAPPR